MRAVRDAHRSARGKGATVSDTIAAVLDSEPDWTLVRGAYFGRYLPSGHLVYVQHATLFAAPFDLDRLELTGPAVPALQGATVNMPVGAAEIAVSDTGTIAYLPAPEDANYLAARIDG